MVYAKYMTAPTPTGRIVPAAGRYNLVLPRVLPVDIDEAWKSITEPQYTARWIGQWEGRGAVGETARLQLGFEEGQPWTSFKIMACESPRWLRVETLDAQEHTAWDLSLELSGTDAPTELLFTMYRIEPSTVGEIGPGWEYYLDQLVLSLRDAPMPLFTDYYPAQREYFQAQVR